MDGLVFKKEDIIWLKAEAWKSEYEDVKLPKPLDQYKLYTEVSKVYSDGSIAIYFTVDEIEMNVFPRFFVDVYLTDEEAEQREELDSCMVDLGRKAYCDKNDDSSDDEGMEAAPIQSKNQMRATQPRGRAKKSPRNVSLDTSDCEEEVEDQAELDGALEAEDVDEVDDARVTFGSLNEEVEVDSMPFDPAQNLGIVKTLRRFEGYTPYRIFVELFMKIIDCVVRCTNAQLEEGVTATNSGEIMVFISIYLLMALVRLPAQKYYWHLDKFAKWIRLPNFREKMTFTRWKELKQVMRFEIYETYDDDLKAEDKAWKIRKIFTLLQIAFRCIMTVAGEHLSADEAMVRCCSRFPLRRVCPNKPIKVGAKFYVLVDYVTKICINISMCDGIINSENSTDYAWGAAGRRIMDLIEFVKNRYHRLYTDNYYTNIALAQELRRCGIYLCGTIRKVMIPFKGFTEVFGKAKHPKPSRHNPKGKWASVYSASHELTIHAVMDSSLVYILDTVFSSHESEDITRRQVDELFTIEGPKALNYYNSYMGGVDQWDQLRTNRAYSVEQVGKTHKWTVTLFLSFISMAASNAFCIYKACNPTGSEGFLDHTEFTLELIDALYNNSYLTRESRSAPGRGHDIVSASTHVIRQAPEGSRGDAHSNRRYRAECRGTCCPAGSKETTYGCKQCGIALHPECFNPFHESFKFGNVKPNPKWVEIFADIN